LEYSTAHSVQNVFDTAVESNGEFGAEQSVEEVPSGFFNGLVASLHRDEEE